MNVNLNTPFFIQFFKYSAFFILGCFVALWFRGCTDSVPVTKEIKVIVPEVRGSIKAKKPISTPIIMQYDKEYIEATKVDDKILLENKQLKLAYEKVNDSLKKVMFSKAIALNNFLVNFSDDNIIIDINSNFWYTNLF